MRNQVLTMLERLYKEDLEAYVEHLYQEGLIELSTFKLPERKSIYNQQKKKVTRNDIIHTLMAINLIKLRRRKDISDNVYCLYLEIYKKLDFYISYSLEFLMNYNGGNSEIIDFMKIYYCFLNIDKRIIKVLFPFKDDIKTIKQLVKLYPEEKITKIVRTTK